MTIHDCESQIVNDKMAENIHCQVYEAFDKSPEPVIAFMQWLVRSYNLFEAPFVVLDMGCGPGRLLTEFTRLDWHVVGMEPEPDFYEEAATLAAHSANMSVRQGGFNDITDVETFDLIAAVNGPFAYLLTREEQVDALERAYRALKPDGILFLDIPNLLWFLKHEPELMSQRKIVNGTEIEFVEHNEFDLHEATFTQTNEYTVKPPNGDHQIIYETHEHAIISLPHLVELVSAAGFVELRTYNSFESRGNERLTGDRIMLSAQKRVE